MTDNPPKKILIIEDSKEILEITEKMLSARGYMVTALSHGRQAMETIQEIQPDLIILDNFLVEHTGIEICRKIKSTKTNQHIPVIITTGHVDSEGSNEELGPDDFLIKPFEVEDLVAKIEKNLP